jgi:hypothetical protein
MMWFYLAVKIPLNMRWIQHRYYPAIICLELYVIFGTMLLFDILNTDTCLRNRTIVLYNSER